MAKLPAVTILFFFAELLFPLRADAQIRYAVQTSGIISTSDTTPFWLHSNKQGIYTDHGNQILATFQLFGKTELTQKITLNYGVSLITRPGERSTLSVNQGYLHLNGFGFEISAGRFFKESSVYPDHIGMGTLGISGNSTPIPMIRGGLNRWVSLPLTNGYIQIRGHLSHGWLGSRRFTEDVLLHEKAGYARLGGPFPVNVYGGLEHQAVWGGSNNTRFCTVEDPQYCKFPSSIRDFPKIFFVQGADGDAPPGEQDYMLGDHRGAWNFGFFLEVDPVHITAYRQFPLETKNNLKFKSPQDALTGLYVIFDKEASPFLSELVYEFLYTKWQNGPPERSFDPDRRDDFKGNENYYNHTIYQTGWLYNRRTIGNPLFIPRENNQGVFNNRIVAHHLGLTGSLGTHMIRLQATFSRNYGTHMQSFDSVSRQLSFGVGTKFPISLNPCQLSGLVEVAYDRGSLVGNQFGILAGIRWSGR